MKTYYIPTSSLNFNNIFSSESISPMGFYSQRKFGYSNWVQIPENPIEGAVLLYDTFKHFSRPASNLEDHPMVIEIQIDEDFPKLQDGIFYSTHTLYLDPWHTRIHFFTEQDKIIALSLSEHSLETKMLRLYKKKIYVTIPTGEYPIITNFDNISIFNSEIEKDIFINKIKGLLYGYYIGSALSTSFANVKHIHALLELNDIVSAVLSNPEKKATLFQQEKLREYLSIINQVHPLYQELLQNNINVEELVQILKKYNILLPFESCDSILSIINFESINNSSILNKIQSQIQRYTTISKDKLLHADASEIVSVNHRLQTIESNNEVDKRLFLLWVNNVLRTAKYNGKISPQRFNIATELTILSRDEYFKEQWDNSQEKIFLNALRHHLNGEKFDCKYSNGLLSSLAAVLIKGDDWEQLLRFMRYKEMNDYRLAFALYGVLNGFANLTKDFTDILLEQDSDYVIDIYTEFYGQLFNKKLETKIMVNTSVNTTIQNVLTVDSVKPHFYNEILQYWNSYNSKQKKDDVTFKSYLDNCGNINGVQFLKGLKTQSGFKKGRAYQYIESFFNRQKQENKIGISQSTLQFSSKILEDYSWIKECADFIDYKKSKKKFFEDVEWFKENYNEEFFDLKTGRKEKGRYYTYSTDNKDVIENLSSLFRYIINNNNPKLKWWAELYSKVPTEQIINYLKIKYADK